MLSMHSEDGGENDLTIIRDGTQMLFHIIAREIYAQTVTYKMLSDVTGYLRLSGFHGECVEEVKEAAEEAKEEAAEAVEEVKEEAAEAVEEAAKEE